MVQVERRPVKFTLSTITLINLLMSMRKEQCKRAETRRSNLHCLRLHSLSSLLSQEGVAHLAQHQQFQINSTTVCSFWCTRLRRSVGFIAQKSALRVHWALSRWTLIGSSSVQASSHDECHLARDPRAHAVALSVLKEQQFQDEDDRV